MSALLLAKILHVVCVVGTLGGLLLVQLALPASVRNDAATGKRITRVLSVLLLLGLLAGALRYGLRHGEQLGAHFNGVIGFKFAILLLVGGLLPMSRKEGRGDKVRWLAIILLLLGALAAGTL